MSYPKKFEDLPVIDASWKYPKEITNTTLCLYCLTTQNTSAVVQCVAERGAFSLTNDPLLGRFLQAAVCTQPEKNI